MLKKEKSLWLMEFQGNFRLMQLIAYTFFQFKKAQRKKRKIEHSKNFDQIDQIHQDFCADILRRLHLEIRTENHDSAHKPKPHQDGMLILSNHRSVLDILILTSIFGGKLVSRNDVKDWPLFGKIAQEPGTIFVDRKNPWSGAKAIRQIQRTLKRGEKLIAFPEGKTNRYPVLGDFQQGVFAALNHLHTQIIPVAIAYPPGLEYVDKNFKEHVIEILNAGSVPIEVSIGKSLSPQHTSKQTMNMVREKIETLMVETQNRLLRRTQVK